MFKDRKPNFQLGVIAPNTLKQLSMYYGAAVSPIPKLPAELMPRLTIHARD